MPKKISPKRRLKIYLQELRIGPHVDAMRKRAAREEREV
jgi:hypothetical protein